MRTKRFHEPKPLKGVLSTRQVVTFADGTVVDVEQAGLSSHYERVARERGLLFTPALRRNNLIVNSGRDTLAHILGGDSSAFVNRVQIGDCTVDGLVVKSSHPPDLSDNRLVHEIRTLAGAPGATFVLDGHTYPALVTKTEPAGLPGTLVAGATSVFSDETATFITDGVTDSDKVTIFIGDEDFSLAIRQVLSETELEVENPSQLSAAGVHYAVTTPGGQILFHKVIHGSLFPEAEYGPLLVAHELGLLYDDGSLFNRITITPSNDAVGMILQPPDIHGTSLGFRLEWLITF